MKTKTKQAEATPQRYRHGDLVIDPVKTIPKSAKPKKGNVLAHGDSTGHSHAVVGQGIQVLEDGELIYLRAQKRLRVTHQEHQTIELDAGSYRVMRKRQYTPEGWVPVYD